MTDFNKYNVVLQNNASKEFFNFSGLTNESVSNLYYKFNVELDLEDGEYTYASFINNREDVEFEYRTPLLDTILHIAGHDDIILRDLQPSTGLLKIGDKSTPINVYDDGNDTNKIFYYDN